MNSENSETPKLHILILKLINKSSYNNNKFKTSAPTWNGEFELPDGPDSV